MSWMPATDPVLGDAQSCDALKLVVVPRVRDLGGFSVRRALPQARRQMVGPFIFFDQMGPVQFVAGQGMDVRPHPHIGLATVTYLFDGRVMHRDSKGNAREIIPGEMNLMTAGSGIAHSERTPPDARVSGIGTFGIQSWVALPATQEETAPSFQHFPAADLRIVEDRGIWARVIAGSAFGQTSPVNTLSDWLYAEVRLGAGASAPFDPDQEERAIYLVDGEIQIASETFEGPRLLIFRPGVAHHGDRDARRQADVPGWRRTGRAALHLVEFRLLASRSHRGGEGRLEIRPVQGGARRDRVHPAAGRVVQLSPPARFSSARQFRITTSLVVGMLIMPSARNRLSVRLTVSMVSPR
jgi:hypothetical protein